MCFFFLIWSPLLIHLFMKKSWVGIHGVTHGSKLIKRENKNTWTPFSVYQVLLWLPHLCTQHFHSYTNLQVVHTKWGTAQSEENINDHAVFSKQNTFWGKLVVVLQNCSHRASRYVVSLSYFWNAEHWVISKFGDRSQESGSSTKYPRRQFLEPLKSVSTSRVLCRVMQAEGFTFLFG